MNNVLFALCTHSTNIMDGWHPFPAWAVAQCAGVSLYKARKELRKLKEEGLAYTFSAVLDSEEPLPYNGWGITEKARKTEEYILAVKKRSGNMCKMFRLFGG